jgi:4-hydroxy-tetrahydrodipicolinate synthase
VSGDAHATPRARIRERLRGYFCAQYTPFFPSGEVDYAALKRNARATLAKPGVGGLSLHSIHQEFWTLTQDERMRVTDAVLEAVAGDAPVVVGVSDLSARNATDLAKHAQAAGAAAVMLWPPWYGPRTPAGVNAFYREVASGIDIGFFCYSTTLSELGYHLDEKQVEALLAIEHMVGVQVTAAPELYGAMLQRVGGEVCVTTSLEETLLHGKRRFPESAVDFTLGSSRPLFTQSAAKPHCGLFMEALLAGKLDKAETHTRTIMGIAQKLQTRYFNLGFHHVSLFKRLAGLLGLETHGLRAPLAEPASAELAECEQVLRDAGLLDTA